MRILIRTTGITSLKVEDLQQNVSSHVLLGRVCALGSSYACIGYAYLEKWEFICDENHMTK